MSSINPTLIFDEILKFLIRNKNILLDEHHTELLNCLVFLKQFTNVSSTTSDYGCHFANCPWSSNLCKEGPDTCACYMVENRLIKIKKLMLLYERLN